MKIGIIGWYGHDNAGDERMLHCLRREFAAHELWVYGSLDEALEKLAELNECDFVLVGGGGLILRDFNHYAPLFEGLQRPFGCVGLSVESGHRSTQRLLSVIKEKAKFILVRDQSSRDVLDNHFKVIVGPDLSFLDPFPVVPVVEDDVWVLNLRDWHFWRGEFNGIVHRVVRRLGVDRDRLRPLIRGPHWRPETVVETLRREAATVRALPLYCEQVQRNDVRVLGQFFENVPAAFDPADLSRCRYLVTMRLHGAIFAAQMGIPFVMLSYQRKCTEFCRAIGMEQLCVDIHHLDTFPAAVDQVKNEYNAVRGLLLSRTKVWQNEISQILVRLKTLVEEAGRGVPGSK